MIKQIIENAFKSWQECGGMLFNSQNDKLSLASKQSLLSLVREEIYQNHEVLVYYKKLCNEFYNKCDKENPDTSKIFEDLNACRTMVRIKNKRIKQLARIAKELKLSMK